MKKISKVKLNIGKDRKGKRLIIRDDDCESTFLETIQCEVIGVDVNYEEYLVAIPDDVRGFTISDFHTAYFEVPLKFRGKKFNTVSFHALKK